MAHKCSYFLCGKSRKNTPKLRRFSFPIKDVPRCNIWISNAGNPELNDLSPEKLKARFLCQDHFRKRDIANKNLVPTAVPICYNSCLVPEKTYRVPETFDLPSTSGVTVRLMTPPRIIPTEDASSSDEVLMDITSDTINCTPKKCKVPSPETPRKKALKRQLILVERKLQRTKEKFFSSAPRNLNNLPTFSKALTTMQLYHKKRSAWLSTEKITALSIYYKSPSTYKFLRSRGVILPAPSTIASWLKNFNYRPGRNQNLFKALKLKVETMPKQMKECVLTFDEMSIKRCIEYSRHKDVIEGYEDLGEFGRKPVLAKQALVLMLRGIYSNWKIPIAFYFTEKGVSSIQLIQILRKNLNCIQNIGLNVLATICDQSAVNQQVFRKLNLSTKKPYFENNGQRYFWIFDVPHLMKNIRNNLLQANFLIDDKTISFNDIRQVYLLDKTSTTGKSMPKLTDTHISPNDFQKMNVRLAVQVLSSTVSAAMRTAIESNQLQSQTASATADFVKMIDNTFDALNSRKLHSNKICNSAMSETNNKVFQSLNEALHIFRNLQKIGKNGELTRPPSFDGFVVTITSILELYDQQKSKGYSFLLTSRLNQDILENLFSIIRQRGGYARNPTVRNFQAAFKANCVHNLLKASKHSAYENEVETTTLLDTSSKWDNSEDEEEDSEEEIKSSSSDSPETVKNTLEDCSIIYFAGYLFKKCFEKYNCEQCKVKLSSEEPLTEENDILLFYKNYNISDQSALKKPSSFLANVVRKIMFYFNKYFELHRSKRQIIIKLAKLFSTKLQQKFPLWYRNDQCIVHRNFIFKFMLRTLLYKKCKFNSQNFKTKKTFDKLAILTQ